MAEQDQERAKVFAQKMGPLIANREKRSKVAATYFKNLPKTERRHTEEAVRELLGNRRILHGSFIGNSVMELLVEKDDVKPTTNC